MSSASAAEPTVAATAALPHGARVLVVRLSALGDVLFALETVAALKRERPDVVIDYLIEDRFQALLQDHPQIDTVHVFPRRHKLRIPGHLLALRARHYDVVLDLHGIQKSALQVLCVRARHKLGYAAPGSREGVARCYDRAVKLPEPLPHRADMGLWLLQALGLRGERTAPQLAALAPDPGLLAAWPGPRVLLHPGTSAFAPFKRWPIERFAELARMLVAAGVSVGISQGPGEADLVAPLRAAVPAAPCIDGGRLGLRGLAGVLRECAVVVAADTGPLHIAAAMGTPCVALFGPKEVARYGPRPHARLPHRILFADVPCRPCTRRDCASPQCVLGVDVDTVRAAVLELLAGQR